MKMYSKYFLAAAMACSVPGFGLAQETQPLFGAIAYSQQSAHYGWSINMKSQEEAETSAMNQCYNYGSDCKSTWFSNGCGALAIGKDGGWGTNFGDNRRQAENKAIAQCGTVSTECKIEFSKCTDNLAATSN
jgi:serine/threonine-protein kinase